MSLWTKLRDTVIRPALRTTVPGFAQAEAFLGAVQGGGAQAPPQATIAPPSTQRNIQPIARSFSPMYAALPALPGAGNVIRGVGRAVGAARTIGGAARAVKNMGEARPDGRGGFIFDEVAITGRRKRHRRMNPTNVKALRRAIRRVDGFVRIEKRVDKLLSRVAAKRGMHRRRPSNVVSLPAHHHRVINTR